MNLWQVQYRIIPLMLLALYHHNPQNGNRLTICMRISKCLAWSCTRAFEGPMAHVSEKVKVNMLLHWYGLDGKDIYDGFKLDVQYQYDLDLIWALFDRHCEPICNFCAARWKFRTVTQAPSETLDTFYKRITKLAKQF